MAPVAPILINLAIGIALSAIGYLLSPKPKAPSSQDRRADLSIAGSEGRTRFTRSSNFDSVQELARLGSVVPLIFARHENGFGGVRVDSDMLFSQMVSSGNNQLLHAVLMLGLGNMSRPDFDGLAIGDLLLRDFSEYKSRLYYRNQGRIVGTDKYTESQLDVPSGSDQDSFSVWWPRRSGYEQYFLRRSYALDQDAIWLLLADSQRPPILCAVRVGTRNRWQRQRQQRGSKAQALQDRLPLSTHVRSN